MNTRATAGELVRYGVKGSAGVVANIAIMAGLVEIVRIPETVAAVLSTLVVLAGGYVVMNRWVFAGQPTPTGRRAHLRRGGAYYAVLLTGKAVNYAIFVALLSLGVWYPAAWVCGALAVFAGTFTANRHLWRSAAA